MKTVWLLQENTQNQLALKQMRQILSRQDTSYHEVSLAPFSDELRLPSSLSLSDHIICWGPGFVSRTLQYKSLHPGIWYAEMNFSWGTFRQNWGNLMMNATAEKTSFCHAIQNLTETNCFIRPDLDSKAFDGGLYCKTAPPKLRGNFQDTIDVIVAPVMHIADEWRFFVVNGHIISASSYRIDGRANSDGFILF